MEASRRYSTPYMSPIRSVRPLHLAFPQPRRLHLEASSDSWDDSQMSFGADFEVGTSQPDEDEDLRTYGRDLQVVLSTAFSCTSGSHPQTNTVHAIIDTSKNPSRPRLIRRAPPAKPNPDVLGPRNFNLIRRVSPPNVFVLARKAAEMQKKRQRARDQARRIAKQLRKLTATTIRLQRKHRQLSTFIAGCTSTCGENQDVLNV
ncbi:hypothetical protein K438DRAFT_1861835 [Mycena galopus ATCC 62051]|nr:hypothetical protein K438DRAFT_1861835 [Mycena galopus ATCC 62051]